MRARAIENGCFVFAAAQGGKHENGRETFGHSLVVDPWGHDHRRGRHRAGRHRCRGRSGGGRGGALAAFPSLLHGRRFEVIEPMAEPTYLRAVRAPS